MNQFDVIEMAAKLGIFFVPFLFALCFHELAHGLVAKWKGDNTAQMMGRLTMNPFAHADPIGTWALPIMAIVLKSPFFFGWAKPVPVNPRNLRRPQQDMFWVAIAGPASNVLLALVGTVALAIVYWYFQGQTGGTAFVRMLETFLMINLFLAVFNLIPIHPLDGGKVIAPFLPVQWNIWLEQNQNTLSIVLLMFILFAGHVLAVPVFYMAEFLRQVAISIAMLL